MFTSKKLLENSVFQTDFSIVFFSPSCAKVGKINTSEILLFSLGKMHKATDLGNTSCLPCFEKLLMINFSVFIDQIFVKITEAKSNISR